MFERFTEKARRTLFFARYEASQLGATEIDTEHLLLGVMREDRAITLLYIAPTEEIESVRRRVTSLSTERPRVSTSMDLPLSQAAKRALAYCDEESTRLQHAWIGPAHLLLGLLREEGGLAAAVLKERGVTLGEVRKAVKGAPPSNESGQGGVEFNAGTAHGMIGAFRPPWMFPPGIQQAMTPVFDWFKRATGDVTQALMGARANAVTSGEPCVETKHLLLALLHDQVLGTRFFGSADAVEAVRRRLTAGVSSHESVSATELPVSEPCKRVIAYAVEEAEQLKHGRIGSEHVLLGLLREEQSAAAAVLRERGLTISDVRAAIALPSAPPEGRNYV